MKIKQQYVIQKTFLDIKNHYTQSTSFNSMRKQNKFKLSYTSNNLKIYLKKIDRITGKKNPTTLTKD